MKTTLYIAMALLSCLVWGGCSNDEYISNDPSADSSAPPVYDINDLYQEYSLFFKPRQGWVGDPMPYYENGKFHVFYLHDARDGADTFHPIHKAVTTDFVTYQESGEMIPCGEDNSREDALGTGSVFKEGDTYYFFYTAHNSNMDPREEIFLATSKDLDTWQKKGKVLDGIVHGYDRHDFRDPFIMKDGNGKYIMLVTTRADYKGSWRAVIAQYTSHSLTEGWELAEPFYDSTETYNLECPDVFVMGNYQYLIFSEQNDRRGVHYVYRPAGTQQWTVPADNFLDGYAYYAAKTASDGTNRYLFGWCPTREGNADQNGYSWAGALVVHRIIQQANGELRLAIPETITQRFGTNTNPAEVWTTRTTRTGNSYTLKGDDQKALALFPRMEGQNRISATIRCGNTGTFGFEFGASGSRKYVYDLTIDPAKNVIKLDYVVAGEVRETHTSTRLPQSSNGEYRVTLIVENSVCVAYVNDEVALSNRIYQMNGNLWGIFAHKGEATFTLEVFK